VTVACVGSATHSRISQSCGEANRRETKIKTGGVRECQIESASGGVKSRRASMRRPFATVLVGPSALLREGLTRILEAADFRIVGSGSCVDDLVPAVLARSRSLLSSSIPGMI
jgi:hypothetical protein